MSYNRDGSPYPDSGARRLLTRAETCTLLGMLLSIASLFLNWPRSLNGALIAPAMVVNLQSAGAAIPEVRWPVTFGAIVAGLVLAFRHAPSSRVPLAFVQVLCGLVCFMIALLHFAIMPGPLLELLGGALILFGAVDRLAR